MLKHQICATMKTTELNATTFDGVVPALNSCCITRQNSSMPT